MVLVHGGHGSWLHWIANIEVLARDFRVMVPDLPGYGDSPPLPSPPEVGALAEALGRAMDAALPRAAVHMVGFSLGGLIASRAAAARAVALPGGVASLSLVGSAASGTPRRPVGEMRSWRKLTGDAQNAMLRHNMAVHMLADGGPDAELGFAAYAAAVRGTRVRGRGIAQGWRLAEVLRDFPAPVQFIWGGDDVTCTPDAMPSDLLAGRRLTILSGVGHWAQFQAANAVNRLIADWAGGKQ